jgi:hypothetical protein
MLVLTGLLQYVCLFVYYSMYMSWHEMPFGAFSDDRLIKAVAWGYQALVIVSDHSP